MCHWEPARLCTAIAPFWFSTKHPWMAVMPFWLSTDNIAILVININIILRLTRYLERKIGLVMVDCHQIEKREQKLLLTDIISGYTVSWEPEGHYQFSKMFCWEPEGHYRCTKSMAIAPFWFSMKHLWIVIVPFWLSTDDNWYKNQQDYITDQDLHV